MPGTYRRRRLVISLIFFVVLATLVIINGQSTVPTQTAKPVSMQTNSTGKLASDELQKLAVKGRAPKTNYSREQFGTGWATTGGCDTRNIILNRDLSDVHVDVDENCYVTKGVLNDPYTGKIIQFIRGTDTSADVQIDHVVALSDAWQKGAQQLTKEQRIALANDPLELLAVDGPANQQKSDGDAATWLPAYKPFRCQYVARQIAVKQKYTLWVTQAEKDAMLHVLSACPLQTLPVK